MEFAGVCWLVGSKLPDAAVHRGREFQWRDFSRPAPLAARAGFGPPPGHGLSGINDPDLLAWAANERRIILTHDVTTLRRFAENRVRANQPMSGVFEVGEHLSVRDVIEDLLLLAECSHEGEWKGQVLFLPLR
jgi:hypothetical protein